MSQPWLKTKKSKEKDNNTAGLLIKTYIFE